MDDRELGAALADLSPEQLQQLYGQTHIPEEQKIIEEEIQKAMEGGKPISGGHTTGLGALLGGLGDVARQANSLFTTRWLREQRKGNITKEDQKVLDMMTALRGKAVERNRAAAEAQAAPGVDYQPPMEMPVGPLLPNGSFQTPDEQEQAYRAAGEPRPSASVIHGSLMDPQNQAGLDNPMSGLTHEDLLNAMAAASGGGG